MKRWSRASSLGALLLLVAAVSATASPITASATGATPSIPPRNELSVVAPAGSLVSTMTTDSPTISGTADGRSWTGDDVNVFIKPPPGEQFKVGTFETVQGSGFEEGRVYMQVSNRVVWCDRKPQGLTIHEAVYEADVLTSFAATWQAPCGGVGNSVGELRLNSTVGSQRAGSLALGQDAPSRRVTFTAPEATTIADLAWTGDIQGVTRSDTCSGTSLAAGETCTVDIQIRPIEAGGSFLALTIRDAEARRLDTVTITALGAETPDGAYTSLATPKRFLDTRPTNTPLRAGTPRDVQVMGVNGVPSTGISTVVVNLTVVAPGSGGYLTAYPAGTTPPTASSMNFSKGQTIANLVTVRVNGGKIRLLSSASTSHVIVDVVGYYRNPAGTSGTRGIYGSFQRVEPFRLYDSRSDVKVEPHEVFDLAADFGDINRTIKAFALTVTAVSPEGSGYLTLWNGVNAATTPTVSNLNFTTGRVVPNMAVVPVGNCDYCGDLPAFTVANGSAKPVHVIVDVVGFFDDNTLDYGSRLKPLASPKRIVDSRSELGLSPLTAGATGTANAASVSTPWTTSLSGNLTAVGPTKNTWLTIWEAGAPKPGVSSMNPYAGQNVAAMVMPDLSGNRQFSVNNAAGTTNVILDVVGAFEFYRVAEVPVESGVLNGAPALAGGGSGGTFGPSAEAAKGKLWARGRAETSTGQAPQGQLSKINSR